MKRLLAISILAFSVTGCANMQPMPQPEQKPVLSCANCSGLVYFVPARPNVPDPRVQMAGVIVDGIKTVAGITAGAYAATDIASTIAGAGQALVVPGGSTTTSTVTAVQPQVVTTERVVPQQVVNPQAVKPEIVNPVIVDPVIVQP